MGDLRLIKKYPNRRLYDTLESRYITLNDVQRLVREGEEIRVSDSQSGEDITRAILIQIITEQEASGNPMFSTETLTHFIRFYDESLQGAFTQFLEQSLALYTEQQRQMQNQLEKMLPGQTMQTWGELTERNLSLWREMQEGFFRAAGLVHSPGFDKDRRKP